MKVTEKPHLHRNWIDSHAFGIVKALQKRGHTTYLVGGCVRDLLLGIVPKDYDIATTAQPDEVRGIIYKSYVIGKRFRLVLVKRGNQQFEVATFRRENKLEEGAPEDSALPLGDNLFGTPAEDAQRRDFTVNALFYDPIEDNLIDFAGGMTDHEKRLLKMIGEPNKRLLEDPVRILRALRLAHKVSFSLDPELRQAMSDQAESLKTSALPRRREEWIKLLKLKHPLNAFLEAYDLGILKAIAPQLHGVFEDPEQRESFSRCLLSFHEHKIDYENPGEVFGFLVHAFVRATLDPDPMNPRKSREFLENENIARLMRDELGMFKSEQSMVARALHLQSMLNMRGEFERRGKRRQMAVLTNDGFPLAIKFALKDLSLSPADWHYWYNLYWENWAELTSTRSERPIRRRRPRRKRKPEGSTGQVTAEGE